MPKFIDSHAMKPFTAEVLRKLQKAPKDEFGVTHDTILYNEAENRLYCILDAPDKRSVDRHHAKAGVECEWIHEVQSTRM